jgi:hypothetical protein
VCVVEAELSGVHRHFLDGYGLRIADGDVAGVERAGELDESVPGRGDADKGLVGEGVSCSPQGCVVLTCVEVAGRPTMALSLRDGPFPGSAREGARVPGFLDVRPQELVCN